MIKLEIKKKNKKQLEDNLYNPQLLCFIMTVRKSKRQKQSSSIEKTTIIEHICEKHKT